MGLIEEVNSQLRQGPFIHVVEEVNLRLVLDLSHGNLEFALTHQTRHVFKLVCCGLLEGSYFHFRSGP